MVTEVIMPSLGESVFEGTISSWLKKEGDRVELYEPILEIETDKVTTEATAEVAGTLIKIVVSEGQTVSVGTVLAFIGDLGDKIAESSTSGGVAESGQDSLLSIKEKLTAPNSIPQTRSAKVPSNGPTSQPPIRYTGRISPVVGRIAAEHNINLDYVTGTGKDGRITKQDILAYIEFHGDASPKEPTKPVISSSGAPEEATAETMPGELLAHTTMRRAIAEHMVRSKHTSPHVTTVFEVDLSNVANHRQAHKEHFARDGVNLTYTAYVILAIVQALQTHPIVNSVWTDDGILFKKEINIGMATAINDGLIVPVIKNANTLSLFGIAQAVNDLAARSRDNRLLPDEVQGGTFTVTNHGVSGSLFATPIINQPQCAILGLGKIEKRVKVINDAIAIRLMTYASLTFDHRILDGATADAFMSTFQSVLENWT